jgi:hypothetical protein
MEHPQGFESLVILQFILKPTPLGCLLRRLWVRIRLLIRRALGHFRILPHWTPQEKGQMHIRPSFVLSEINSPRRGGLPSSGFPATRR